MLGGRTILILKTNPLIYPHLSTGRTRDLLFYPVQFTVHAIHADPIVRMLSGSIVTSGGFSWMIVTMWGLLDFDVEHLGQAANCLSASAVSSSVGETRIFGWLQGGRGMAFSKRSSVCSMSRLILVKPLLYFVDPLIYPLKVHRLTGKL